MKELIHLSLTISKKDRSRCFREQVLVAVFFCIMFALKKTIIQCYLSCSIQHAHFQFKRDLKDTILITIFSFRQSTFNLNWRRTWMLLCNMQCYLFLTDALNFIIDNDIRFLLEIEQKGMLAVICSICIMKYMHNVDVIKPDSFKRIVSLPRFLGELQLKELFKMSRRGRNVHVRLFLSNKYSKSYERIVEKTTGFSKYVY